MKSESQLELLPDEELNAVLAQILGWTYHDIEYAYVGGGGVFEKFWLPPGVNITTLSAADISTGPNHGRSLPNFTGDLNAVHEVEMKLKDPFTYGKWLSKITLGIVSLPSWPMVAAIARATARQRTTALILLLQS